jgi:hypothetical protein
MGWSFWQLQSYALAELSHVSGTSDPARPDVSGRAQESLPRHIYIPASETSPLAPNTHMLTEDDVIIIHFDLLNVTKRMAGSCTGWKQMLVG